jgi:transcriptional regulator with XRE-family HTH domain
VVNKRNFMITLPKCLWYSAGVVTVAARLAWILEHRGFRSRRALARATKLSPSHISLLMKGERGLGLETAQAIARAAGVDLVWLMTGAGNADGTAKAEPSAEPFVDPHPRRDQALALLAGSIDPPVRAALLKEQPAHDLPLEGWLARARELQLLLREFRESVDKEGSLPLTRQGQLSTIVDE